MLPQSTLVKKQTATFRKDFYEKGEPVTLIVHVRFDDSCGNGHNTFAITADRYEARAQRGEPTVQHKDGKELWLNGCGCLHDEIRKHFPELAQYVKWHLVSTDEPMHYIANTLYHAGDRDCWGLRKGETRQIRNGKTGKPSWILSVVNESGECVDEPNKYVDADAAPECNLRLAYLPWLRVGEGKERDLNAARSCAVWPEATDEQLMAEPAVLKAALEARQESLMVAFKAAVESLGFTY